MVVMAPGDEKDIAPMFEFALEHGSPVALRYPRANLETIEREVQPVELGQAEILEWETDGMLLACGAMVGSCLRVAKRLLERYGLRVGVVNARFVKPLDRVTIGKAIEECGFVLTRGRGMPRWAASARRFSRRPTRPGFPPATSGGWACPTATSCTPSGTNNSPRSVSTSTASPRPPSSWRSPPAGRHRPSMSNQGQGGHQLLALCRPRARNPGRQ